MARFEYKDGCLRCNQCGRLHEPIQAGDSTIGECPCGNSERLDALDRLVELYNKGLDGSAAPPPEPPAEPGAER